MSSHAIGSVIIQTSSESVPSTPSWLGEGALLVAHLHQQGALDAISQQMRFVCRRFGRYEVIDFVAVLFGYAISGERTLETFYERLPPFAAGFKVLFGRDRLPARSTLSRFLASLTQLAIEALHMLFLEDGLVRPLGNERQISGLVDRIGKGRVVFYIDGTREAARQRALPQTPDRPPPARRLGAVCARGYTGRKRGELVRTRTTVLQAHRSQWLGTFGNAGNGQYREELHRAVATIQRYAKAHMWPVERMLVRLDGQYRTGAVLAELAGLAYVMRGKDYQLLDRPEIQHASTYLPISSSVVRKVAWCARPTIALTWRLGQRGSAAGSWSASQKKPRVGVRRAGLVYEFFLTCLPQAAFTTANVVALYLHRGAFENALADEDLQQDPDRWCSHAPGGQEAWQIISQWVWNVRLELGHHLEPTALRTTEFAPALPPAQEHAAPPASYAPAKGPCPSNRAASGDVTLSSNQMVPCVARLGRRSLRPKRVVRGMVAYGWCMQRASVNVEAARCASSASGMAVPR